MLGSLRFVDLRWRDPKGEQSGSLWLRLNLYPALQTIVGNLTIKQKELERQLGLGRVDSDELAFLLSQHFKGADYPSERQVDYPHAERPLISLIYDSKGVVQSIIPGHDLTGEAVNRIMRDVQEKLLSPPVAKTYNMILFAHVPTEGYWRYRDQLVIRRAPDQAPRPIAITGQHPLVLEVAYAGAEDGYTDKIRWERESHKWALLLTLLVPGLQIPRRVEFNHTWVVPTSYPPPPGPHTSIESQEVYLFPGLHAGVTKLSEQGSLPEIELVETVPIAIDHGQVLTFSRQTTTRLDAFSSLSEVKKARILRSAYWLHHSIDVWRLSKSASYQSIIQAVEAVIDVPKGQPQCLECHRTLGPGPTKLFTEFLDRYAPAPQGSKSARNVLYGTRSSLTHGDALLHMDHGTMFAWHKPIAPYEHALVSEARQICRQAIITWLERQ
jgi:hypothetical protein